MKGDAEETVEALGVDKTFAAEIEENCAEKPGVYAQEERPRMTPIIRRMRQPEKGLWPRRSTIQLKA